MSLFFICEKNLTVSSSGLSCEEKKRHCAAYLTLRSVGGQPKWPVTVRQVLWKERSRTGGFLFLLPPPPPSSLQVYESSGANGGQTEIPTADSPQQALCETSGLPAKPA